MPSKKDPYILTDEQKQLIHQSFKINPDLKFVVEETIGKGVDPRTKAGRAVRTYLKEMAMTYDTANRKDGSAITYTESQKNMIHELVSRGKNALEICESLYQDRDIQKFCKEHHAMVAYIKEYNNPTEIELSADGSGKTIGTYVCPKGHSLMCSKINAATGETLDKDQLTRQEEVCVDKLIVNMNNSRFVTIINAYKTDAERKLFEQEFIRNTWRKADLIPEEVNAYFDLCRSMVDLEGIYKHKQKLAYEIDCCNDRDDMSIKLTEMYKGVNKEYDDLDKRIKASVKILAGDRSKRLERQKENQANFLYVVKAFQEEKDRQLMVKTAEMQRKLVKDEADRLESVSEFKARILGITKESVI